MEAMNLGQECQEDFTRYQRSLRPRFLKYWALQSTYGIKISVCMFKSNAVKFHNSDKIRFHLKWCTSIWYTHRAWLGNAFPGIKGRFDFLWPSPQFVNHDFHTKYRSWLIFVDCCWQWRTLTVAWSRVCYGETSGGKVLTHSVLKHEKMKRSSRGRFTANSASSAGIWRMG